MNGRCRAKVCGAEIVFARTAMGKSMPLDIARYADDDELANVALFRDAGGNMVARVLRKGEQPEPYERRAMPHFATCVARLAERDKIPGVRSLERARKSRA